MKWLRPAGLPQPAQDWLDRALLDLRSIGGHRDYTKFVIVGIARTGSTMLLELLNSNSQVLAFGELFRTPEAIGWDIRPFGGSYDRHFLSRYRTDPQAFIDDVVFGPRPRVVRAVGFKLFYYHAQEAPFSDVWKLIVGDGNIRIIHLMRRNILAQFVSLKLAHKTQVWSATRKTAGTVDPIRLDSEECRKHFEQVRRHERECDALFRDHQKLNIYYEDLVRAQEAEMGRTLDFLEVGAEPGSSTRLVRQRTVPLSEAITNFSELRAAFRNSEWGAFCEVDPDGNKII
ncbi:MAG: sulfotransferase [Mesorhizobium sp.]|nr:MAG: sulfotransferase [Mesorhizobium sp.]